MPQNISTSSTDAPKELRSGLFSIDTSAGRTTYKVDRDRGPAPIKAWAIPDLTEIFDRLSPDQPIRSGDLIVVRYKGDGSAGAAKVDIVSADATYSAPEKISSLRGRGVHADASVEKDITSLFREAYYDWRSQSYNREATWDPTRPGATEIFVLRAKSSATSAEECERKQSSTSTKLNSSDHGAGKPDTKLPVNPSGAPFSIPVTGSDELGLSSAPTTEQARQIITLDSLKISPEKKATPLTLNQLKQQREYLTKEAKALRGFIETRAKEASKQPESSFAVGALNVRESKEATVQNLKDRASGIEKLLAEQQAALKGLKGKSDSETQSELLKLNNSLKSSLVETGEKVGIALAAEKPYTDSPPAHGLRKVFGVIGSGVAAVSLIGLFTSRSNPPGSTSVDR